MSRTFEMIPGDDARAEPVRVVVVQEDERPAVDLHDDDVVMTFPHLFVKELIAIVSTSIVLVLAAVLFDAPLEEIANPLKTPNPAKAPWYFLGLQELLHYFPPLVSGVILPGLVLIALAVIPYFNINISREPFWDSRRREKLSALAVTLLLLVLFLIYAGAHPMWPIVIASVILGGLMALPGIYRADTPLWRWLSTRSLAFWIFTWFLTVTVILTVIGTFFRGPGWTYTLPWRDGIF